MKKTLISTAVILSLCASSVFGQQLLPEKISLKHDKNLREASTLSLNPVLSGKLNFNRLSKIDLLNDAVLQEQNSGLDISKVKDNVYVQETKKKSVLLGLALSALIPGAGEFYAKSYVKAAVFFGVELLAWGAFTMFQIKGDNKTDEFQNYADRNWNVRQYAQWLVDFAFAGSPGINPNEPNLETLRLQINECERQSGFSHTLPPYYTQQYYELIGKYQTFVAGWTDARNGGAWIVTKDNFQSYKTPMFISYSEDRQRANDFYNYAKDGIIVVVLNHILSAADAAWSVSMFNKQVKVETGFEIKRYRSPLTLESGNMPTFNMKVTF